MPQIAIDELPQPLQKLLRQAEETSSPLTITQSGKPFAVIYPANVQRSRPLFGFMQGTGEVNGDIVAPIEQDWGVLQ